MPRLTNKQELFAQHYAIHGDATAAYRAAGYSTDCKPEAQHRCASRTKQKAQVIARIAELQARVKQRAEEKFDLTVDKILARLQTIAFADASDFYKWDATGNVSFKTPDQMTPEIRQCITHIEETRGNSNTVTLKLVDKMQALQLLAKHLGIGAKTTHVHQHDLTADAAAEFDRRMARLVEAAESSVH